MSQDTESKFGVDPAIEGADKTVVTILKLTESQQWLVLRALTQFTEIESIDSLLEEFPDMDLNAFQEDLQSILQKFKPC